MVEFAPNPSGPAHIGTLRTYAVAWLEARKRGLPIFLRFDAIADFPDFNPLPNINQRSHAFLNELDSLDLAPDYWQIVTEPVYLAALPPWAHQRLGEDCEPTFVWYPTGIDKTDYPSQIPPHWKLGAPVPMIDTRGYCPFLWQQFAYWIESKRMWQLALSPSFGLQMHLRQTSVIVRALNNQYLRMFSEVQIPKYFGFHQPDVLYTGVVCSPDGALSKSELSDNAFGTVGEALARMGAKSLRERIIESASDDEQPMISVDDLVGGRTW